tara:strand:- start:2 stop:481 length:480 start_codon:yes stop_codon:yes gene_type:complete
MKTIIVYFLFFFGISLPAFGDDESSSPVDENQLERVVTLSEGEPAPFNGTLFSTAAAASLLIEIESTRERCQLIVERETGLLSARHDFETRLLNSRLDGCQTRYNEIFEIKDNQIDMLTSQVADSSGNKNAWWYAGGVVSGIALSVITTYAISQSLNHN